MKGDNGYNPEAVMELEQPNNTTHSSLWTEGVAKLSVVTGGSGARPWVSSPSLGLHGVGHDWVTQQQQQQPQEQKSQKQSMLKSIQKKKNHLIHDTK